MRESMLLDYPIAEYEGRKKTLLDAMSDKGFDAMVFSSRENTRYFCGLQSVSWKSKAAAPGVLIVTGGGQYILAGSASARGTMEVTSCVEDIRGFHPKGRNDMPRTLPGLIHAVLKAAGVWKGKIGMELGPRSRLNMPILEYLELLRLCPDANVVDGGELFWPIRMVKSDRELVNIRRSCTINYQAFSKVLHAVHEGLTEKDVYRNTLISMLEQGADEVYSFGVRAGKERYGQPNCTPSDRPIGRDEMILMDGGLIYRGYYSDIIRQAIVGKPNPRQRRFYAASVAACETALDALKPGATAGMLCESVNSFLAADGLGDYAITGCGHGLGLDIHEFPNLECGDATILKPGMVIAVEPSIYVAGEGMFGIEENVLVTDTGYELLTPMSRELIVLD
jgi:Xaa-Pro aminopeptidase